MSPTSDYSLSYPSPDNPSGLSTGPPADPATGPSGDPESGHVLGPVGSGRVSPRLLRPPAPPRPARLRPELPARRSGTRRDRLQHLAQLTPRDRKLLAWLAEHYLLSSEQIGHALFPSARAARLRLAELHRIDAVHRFVDVTTGSRHHLYTLGELGLLVHPTRYNHPDRLDSSAPRTSIERTERIIGSPTLAHLLGVNQFFIDLHAHTRTNTAATLRRWWSEQHATAAYASAGIRPDAHGVWQVGDRTVGFWLEHDRGTEKLLTVLNKLRAYAALADAGGPRYPVLIRVPSHRRETHLLDALADLPAHLIVATGVHADHPAGPAWTLAGDPRRLRYWLHELPSDHGPLNAANNSHRYSPPDD